MSLKIIYQCLHCQTILFYSQNKSVKDESDPILFGFLKFHDIIMIIYKKAQMIDQIPLGDLLLVKERYDILYTFIGICIVKIFWELIKAFDIHRFK